MTSPKKKINFTKIRVRNTPTKATLEDGTIIERTDRVFIPEWSRFVRCIDYDNHFVALNPSKKEGMWFALCSCGSPAVIVGYNQYKHGASPSSGGVGFVAGEMLVCYVHTLFGKHADGST